MTTTFVTEEMTQERGAALVRIRRQQREEEARLRREMDLPVWKDWGFWLGVFFLAARINHAGASEPTWPVGLIVMIIALDRVHRRRARAARELVEVQSDKLPSK